MEHLHTDVAAGISAAFGAITLTVLLGTAAWLGVWFLSLAADQVAAMLRVFSTAGL